MIKHIAALAVLCSLVGFPAVLRADDMTAASITQIDTECNAIQNAIMALHPVHVALVSGKWVVMSEGDYTVAERTHSALTFVDAYKQGKSYAWVHSHTFTASGTQRASQLCFRQSDGSLERVRQASTVPDLAGASAQVAYYTSDGKLIQKTSLFEENDPAIAKQIADLPFYNVLP